MNVERDTGDDGPAVITDHPFEPREDWYTVCRICDLAEAAHETTTLYDEHLHRRRRGEV